MALSSAGGYRILQQEVSEVFSRRFPKSSAGGWRKQEISSRSERLPRLQQEFSHVFNKMFGFRRPQKEVPRSSPRGCRGLHQEVTEVAKGGCGKSSAEIRWQGHQRQVSESSEGGFGRRPPKSAAEGIGGVLVTVKGEQSFNDTEAATETKILVVPSNQRQHEGTYGRLSADNVNSRGFEQGTRYLAPAPVFKA